MLEIRPILSAMWRTKSSALLLIVQIALTLAIVSNAAFIITDRIDQMNRSSGTVEQELFSFALFTFGKDADRAQQLQQLELDEAMLRALPGVKDAVATNQVPMSGSGSATQYRTSADPDTSDMREAGAGIYQGDSHFLSTFGVTLVAGRNFREDEVVYGDESAPSVLLVTQALADLLYPDGDALGQVIYADRESPQTIIGIIERLQAPWVTSSQVERNVVLPQLALQSFQQYVVRAEPSALHGLMAQIEKQMHALYLDRVVEEIRPFSETRTSAYANDRLMSNMLTVLIALLLLITALGIVGMAFFNVNRRTRQIGTRRALGASKGDIVRYFVVENTLTACIGTGFGIGLSLVLNYLLISHYALPKLDYAFIAVSVLGIYLLGLLAVAFPAKRAADISPAIATRSV